jgi:hypothetical protein
MSNTPIARSDEPLRLSADAHPSSGRRFALYALLVVGLAVVLRAVGLDTWSLWEDEEGSLTRAYESPYWEFQRYFPIFFVTLKGYAELVGLSPGWLRAYPAAVGVLSIVLTMAGFRRWVGPRTAALAGLFLAVNLGHLFFSQSIRYYTLALAFQVLALVWFYDGFESADWRKLGLSLAAFVLACLTHFSAILLAPALVGYLMLMVALRERGGGYRWTWYLVYGLVLGGLVVFFSMRMLWLAELIGGWVIPAQRDPVHVGKTVVAYFGAPILGLGLLAPWLARRLSRRTLLLLLTAGYVPVLELLVLAGLNKVNVAWYYGFIGMVPLAVLAAAALTGLWDRGWRAAAVGLGVLAVGYYAAFLGIYYTTGHGDRPRWADAAAVIHRETGAWAGKPDNPRVCSTVAGPVAFHLGVHPSQKEPTRFVQPFPADPAADPPADWYVTEDRNVTPEAQAWLAAHCELRARFEAKTGPADRTVSVYKYRRPGG